MNLKEFSICLTTCKHQFRPGRSATDVNRTSVLCFGRFLLYTCLLITGVMIRPAGSQDTGYFPGEFDRYGTPSYSGQSLYGFHFGLNSSMNRSVFHKFADDQSAPAVRDTVPHPRKVMFRSLMLPGWGQVTNRQIWKVPIVYALLGGLTYYSMYSHSEYTDYKAAYYNEASGNEDMKFGPTPPRLAGVPAESLRFNRNFFRNRRDFTFILIGVAYGLNVLDAYVFAHFRDFDVSDELAHSAVVQPGPFGNPVFSLQYKIRF
jgi:hypothetical protein